MPPGDFNPTPAQSAGVAACQVAWRSDGQELAVMQAARLRADGTGTIVAVKLAHPRSDDPRDQRPHPAWQPVPTGG